MFKLERQYCIQWTPLLSTFRVRVIIRLILSIKEELSKKKPFPSYFWSVLAKITSGWVGEQLKSLKETADVLSCCLEFFQTFHSYSQRKKTTEKNVFLPRKCWNASKCFPVY